MSNTEVKSAEPTSELVEHDMASSYFQTYGEQATQLGAIVGSLLKFSKGDWFLGQDEEEVLQGTKFVAIMDRLDIGWVKWEDSKPVSTRMGKLVEGFRPPKRSELGDSKEDEWEVDDQGRPRDPWQFSNNLIMRRPGILGEPTDDDLVTFATSSRGGIGAIGELCKVFGKEMRMRPDEWPVVETGCGSYKHSNKEFGRIKFPILKVVGWEPKVQKKGEVKADPPKATAARSRK